MQILYVPFQHTLFLIFRRLLPVSWRSVRWIALNQAMVNFVECTPLIHTQKLDSSHHGNENRTTLCMKSTELGIEEDSSWLNGLWSKSLFYRSIHFSINSNVCDDVSTVNLFFIKVVNLGILHLKTETTMINIFLKFLVIQGFKLKADDIS